MAHIRQSRPDCGLGFHVKVLKTFQAVPVSPGSGEERSRKTEKKEEDKYTEAARSWAMAASQVRASRWCAAT